MANITFISHFIDFFVLFSLKREYDGRMRRIWISYSVKGTQLDYDQQIFFFITGLLFIWYSYSTTGWLGAIFIREGSGDGMETCQRTLPYGLQHILGSLSEHSRKLWLQIKVCHLRLPPLLSPGEKCFSKRKINQFQYNLLHVKIIISFKISWSDLDTYI